MRSHNQLYPERTLSHLAKETENRNRNKELVGLADLNGRLLFTT